MYAIHKNSYLQSRSSSVNPRIINRCVDFARGQKLIVDPSYFEPPLYRLTSEQPNIPIENVDPTRRPLAFGRGALPKLRRELHDKDQSVVTAAISSICDLVHDPEKAFEAINLRIPDRLADLLLESLAPIRERAIVALAIIAGQADGKEAIVANDSLLTNLKLCLGDAVTSVRLQTAACLRKIAETWMTADVLVEYEFIQDILNYVQTEGDDIVELLLITLKDLMYGCGKCVALKNNGFRILLNFLNHENSTIVCRALDCLMILTSTPKGQQLAIEKNLLKTLTKLLHYGNIEVCACAASVLMFCTIRTRAKILAAEIKSLPKRLVKLSASLANPNLQMFCIKALSNICEHPRVRKEVRELYIQDLENLQVSDEINNEHKQTLLKILYWCPELVSSQ